MSEITHVAVGVIYNSNGEVLISKRSAERELGGLWEFPGGKIEGGEDVFDALVRELKEEVGLEVSQSEPLMTFAHSYPMRTVKLYVHAIGPHNQPVQHQEGQVVEWVDVHELNDYAFPEANERIVDAVIQYILPRYGCKLG